MEHFTNYVVERTTGKVIRQSIARLRTQGRSPNPATILDALQQQESREPGSVVVRVGRGKQTIILMGQDTLANLNSQKELRLA